MPLLTELSSQNHHNLKIIPSGIIEHAAKQHLLQLRASEIANAACSFPVFLSRNNVNGAWAFSAMCGIELQHNLFVIDGHWQSVFQPLSAQTYPFYLMQLENQEKQYGVGFDAQSAALSEQQGEALFNADKQASPHLSKVTQALDSEINSLSQTHQLTQTLEQLSLIKALDLHIVYGDGQTNRITGLHTIDEDRLRSLPGDTLVNLNDAGYLTPIHAMLMSIYQLNSLINRHNALPGKASISTIKMEVSKSNTLA
ncbi:SapC family protein [Paraglaciecola arctica]|uniref:SapC family protein n=1 Tax=Paraglaciecola arctica TaxID=1128911 RepID=UPI001C07B1D4|nr:SapC family protein [Paraglaciecola arctica]MBU3002299.1 SapC family protein [Paraglaciecola arctica]